MARVGSRRTRCGSFPRHARTACDADQRPGLERWTLGDSHDRFGRTYSLTSSAFSRPPGAPPPFDHARRGSTAGLGSLAGKSTVAFTAEGLRIAAVPLLAQGVNGLPGGRRPSPVDSSAKSALSVSVVIPLGIVRRSSLPLPCLDVHPRGAVSGLTSRIRGGGTGSDDRPPSSPRAGTSLGQRRRGRTGSCRY